MDWACSHMDWLCSHMDWACSYMDWACPNQWVIPGQTGYPWSLSHGPPFRSGVTGYTGLIPSLWEAAPAAECVQWLIQTFTLPRGRPPLRPNACSGSFRHLPFPVGGRPCGRMRAVATAHIREQGLAPTWIGCAPTWIGCALTWIGCAPTWIGRVRINGSYPARPGIHPRRNHGPPFGSGVTGYSGLIPSPWEAAPAAECLQERNHYLCPQPIYHSAAGAASHKGSGSAAGVASRRERLCIWKFGRRGCLPQRQWFGHREGELGFTGLRLLSMRLRGLCVPR
jgi:hypothetical protein